MTCTVAGPHSSEFLSVGMLGRMRVYRNHPHTVQELKRAVRYAIVTLNREVLAGIV
jgi:hypothetical protein